MTPQNEGYYYAAYIVVAVLYGGYAFSLWRRSRPQQTKRRPE
jgi:hypothetical protein